MIATPNKRTIRNLSIKSLKANKLRNIFAVMAIALTTILFTSLLTIGISMNKSLQESSMRQVGGSAHGSFKYLTKDEFDHIKTHKLIKNIEYSVSVGFAKNNELSTRQTEVRYATNKEAEFMFDLPTKGRMPQNENEIALDTIVLDKLGVPHEIGRKVTLTYTINGKQATDKFILSGYWKGDSVTPASMAWVSEKFLKSKLDDIDYKYVKSHIKETGNFTGLIFADVMFSNSFNVENKLLKILKDNGYKEANIPVGVNWAYTSGQITSNLGTIAALIGVMLLIMLSGYLIIYNIFYISVANDTKFYGVLKTIGTTSKQIRSIVKRQAIILSIIGIPIGLVIGYIMGAVLIPFVMQIVNVTHTEIYFNPLVFIAASLFSLVTVIISCRKPQKIASEISPIEAVRYTDVPDNGKRKDKDSTNGVRIYKMAFYNVFRNKKKAIVVMISLSLSIILFNSVYTIVKGFNMDKYVGEFMSSDFVIATVGYFNPSVGYKGQDTLKEKTVDKISSLKGVKNAGRIYFKEIKHKLTDKSLKWLKGALKSEIAIKDKSGSTEETNKILESKEMKLELYGLDKLIWNKFKIYKGIFDAEKFATGNYIIIGAPNIYGTSGTESYYDVGEDFKMAYDDGTEKTYKVMAIGDIPFNLSIKRADPQAVQISIPSDDFKAHVKKPVIMTASFDVEKKDILSVEKYIESYVKTKEPALSYMSKNLYEKEFAKTQSTYNVVGYSLSFVIALIGILNFVNSMATSIISRRKEHAMLQSIGMTGRQLYKMLLFEGLYYALFTILIVVTFGTAFSYIIVKVIAGGIWFFSYHITLVPVAICLPFLIVMSVVIPIICYKTTSKRSIVERLNEIQ
ncbi:ABC transporter permease [Clostridium estertheticum]|uniref:ABC transporter permease n=1 Tax=Clostridium estertheticum TaxID=238834 RepID=UPI001CF55573|nr:FtsX-like permease family protein [Clostridium estertheticum]MCB2338831.1 ABC transporter permease [Clostridium estertheticum]